MFGFFERHERTVEYAIVAIWICNCILGITIAIKESWLPHMSAGYEQYSNISSDPFDGTVSPILLIPDWSKPEYQNKFITFQEIPIKDYIPLPRYNATEIAQNDNSKSSLIRRYTYITTFMGSYRLNYKEYDGSHNAVDIRAPIGTPVLSIANGVVVRTVEADGTGDKFVVVRHDGVMIDSKKTSIYSGYLHLSAITVMEGTKIAKGDMIGRVGMTGITTTPHLHFQIDLPTAPFHPYWPFTSAESRSAGLSMYDSINSGLGKENGLKYSIHPMEFVNANSSGTPSDFAPAKISDPVAVNMRLEDIRATQTPSSKATPKAEPIANTDQKKLVSQNVDTNTCSTNKKFADFDSSSKAGKLLYSLVNDKCMYQVQDKFEPGIGINQREAITMIMKQYDIAPLSGISHFMDIPLGDSFHGYALVLEKSGILLGNYANPGKILSKEEFVELLARIAKLEPSKTTKNIFSDVTPMNVRYPYIQSYAQKANISGGVFSPTTILTRAGALELLASVSAPATKK